jgi:hypothetical protein
VSERSAIVLLDGATREAVEATLIDGVTVAEMEATDRAWQPYMRRAVREAVARGVPPDQLPEHKHWEWTRKARHMTADSRAIGIECHGDMQALMLVITGGKVCRLEEQSGKPLVYVDYLAAAPWNLPVLMTPPRFRGCGTVLITAAIRTSRGQGYEGRIGLHSLPQAEGFYRGCSMVNLGVDPNYEDLPYFEITPPYAEEFERSQL